MRTILHVWVKKGNKTIISLPYGNFTLLDIGIKNEHMRIENTFSVNQSYIALSNFKTTLPPLTSITFNVGTEKNPNSTGLKNASHVISQNT